MSNASDQLVAFVTGAAQGLGLGISKHLLDAGWRVTLFDRDEDAGKEAFDALAPEQQDRALFIAGDVANESDIKLAVQQTVDRFGRIDGLVNNAGIANPRSGGIEHLEWDQWQRVINVNLGGVFLATKHATQHLRHTKGAIVNIASTRAFQSEANTESYAASKGGVVALTHALAVSLAGDVRVNAIAPGWIEVGDWQKSSNRSRPEHSETDKSQHPVGRVGTPEDIAQAVSFLLEATKSGFMTGETIRIDGGMTHKMIYVD
ncbi:glucose 1-dehydrogenase [Thalassospira profundimaris]|uniref:Oxidoreductase n=1 Tax=Thalassospira profundimaris TaxID=502049 RepID=A0A367WTT4_9PROT|nr:glucose 1-dehydrogenase [Thalassospira profundimaris]RCK44619.1 oxidoreductase [Thalassospira profundimaris]